MRTAFHWALWYYLINCIFSVICFFFQHKDHLTERKVLCLLNAALNLLIFVWGCILICIAPTNLCYNDYSGVDCRQEHASCFCWYHVMHLNMSSLFDICHLYSLFCFCFAFGKRHWKQSLFFESVLNHFARFISMNFKQTKYRIDLELPCSDMVSLLENVINVYTPFSFILASTAIVKWLILSRVSVWVFGLWLVFDYLWELTVMLFIAQF